MPPPDHAGRPPGKGSGNARKTVPVLDDVTFTPDENTIFSATVIGRDPDHKDVLAYSFSDGSLTYTAFDGVIFSIDPTSGLITSDQTLNYETTQSYSLNVKVTDRAGQFDTATVTINVQDLNEFAVTAPVDVDDAPNNVQESAAIGTLVGVTASATDEDGTTNTVTYSLVTDATGTTTLTNGPFQIGPNDGVVRVRDGTLIDYETADNQLIYVKATSADGSSAVQPFDVQVSNVNEDPAGGVTISTQAITQTVEITRQLNESDIGDPATQVYSPDNGHIYEFVNTVVSWEDAFSLAAASSLSGVEGYLGTMTSAAENAFVHQAALSRITVGYYGSMWLGASDAETEGSWYWVAGPEAGTQFWQGAGPNGVYGPAGYSVGGEYSNWRGGRYDAPNSDNGEPGDENADYVLMLVQNGGGEPLGTWEDGANSYTPVSTNLPGGNAYVIEYSGDVTETVSETVWLLTADTSSINDPDGNGEFQYQWQKSQDGLNGWNDIDGATEASYQATSEDVGSFFRVQISYTDGGGFNETLVSAADQLVAPEPPPEPEDPPDGVFEYNGHYYEVVSDPNIMRDAAKTEADQSSFELNGITYYGHLATITSSGEEQVIEDKILADNGGNYFSQEPAAFWLGGEFVNNEWTWTSGPETGAQFSYTDWDTDNGGQEAGQGSSEPFVVLNMFARPDINGVWYSYDAGDTGLVRGYVVEYEADIII